MRPHPGFVTACLLLLCVSAPGVVAGTDTGLMRKGPYLIYTGVNTEMQVLWQLDSTATCEIMWGADTSYSLGSDETIEYGDDHQHSYTITDLVPGSRYFYRVIVDEEIFSGSYRTAPETDATGIKFFAYGDSRSYPAVHDSVVAGMILEAIYDPGLQSFILSVGDLVYNGDDESHWDDQFFDPSYPFIQTMLANFPYQATMGNHEGSGVLFQKYFPYPFVDDRYWSFDYGPAHFVVVDQYAKDPASQLAWIADDLATTAKPWKFIYLHEPGWSAGYHGNNEEVQDYIQPLCEVYGVSIVFAGHNHYYARAVVNGVHHVTTGGGGAPLYTPRPGYPNIVATSKSYHFCMIEIDGNVLNFTAMKPDGEIIDSFMDYVPLYSGGHGHKVPAKMPGK
ncbi:MAG: metallophosphoesterase [Candidatus Glassbacteria bacterium]